MSEPLTIPVRGSCRADDRQYDPVFVRIGRRIEILLDGSPLRDVIAYDCERGWVRKLRISWKGRKVAVRGKAVEEILRGNVTVRWR